MASLTRGAHACVHANIGPLSQELQLVRAQFTYMGRRDDELSFEEGDILSVLSTQGKFCTGELRGRVGTFPSNLVIKLFPNSIVKV